MKKNKSKTQKKQIPETKDVAIAQARRYFANAKDN